VIIQRLAKGSFQVFGGKKIEGSDFRNTSFEGACLNGAEMREGDFRGSDFPRV
jgi:uncharacterized protein YjbI with pentapeptide repeats